jgi:hypothetical protein
MQDNRLVGYSWLPLAQNVDAVFVSEPRIGFDIRLTFVTVFKRWGAAALGQSLNHFRQLRFWNIIISIVDSSRYFWEKTM